MLDTANTLTIVNWNGSPECSEASVFFSRAGSEPAASLLEDILAAPPSKECYDAMIELQIAGQPQELLICSTDQLHLHDPLALAQI